MERQSSRTLAGRYRLGAVIGAGGMGTVHDGTDLVLRRAVAVKLIADAFATDPAGVARFEREARAAAALTHPAVVTVYDAGLDGATPFIVMERLAGMDLAWTLHERGTLAPREAVRIGEQIASALAAAHAAGMIHRDIKPANVMLTDEQAVKVLDFGLARAREASAITLPAAAAGTAAYMAPELALGGEADERSDVYSLGCVIYAMLSGGPPFTGQADAAIMHQHVHAPPRPLRRIDARIPQELADMVAEMLAKDPQARPQHAGHAAERLRRLAPPPARRPPLAPQATTLIATTLPRRAHSWPGQAFARAGSPWRARLIALTGLGAALVALLVAVSTIGAPDASRASANGHNASGPRAGASAARATTPGRQRSGGATPAHARSPSPSAAPSEAAAPPASSNDGERAPQARQGGAATGPYGGRAEAWQAGEGNGEGERDGGSPSQYAAHAPGGAGQAGDPPGQVHRWGLSPGTGGLPQGHRRLAPGAGGAPPGDGGVPPGHGAAPPGQLGESSGDGQHGGG